MKLSVVTTMYHSGSYISEFYRRVKTSIKKITSDYEIIFVNDGCPENSLTEALEIFRYDEHIKVIDFSKNFGHHKAIMIGLKHSTGDYVFLIDCDLEEKPEWLEKLWQEITADPLLDVVYGIQKSRKGGWFEKISGHFYYKLLNSLIDFQYQPNTLTARLMTREYINAVIQYNEKMFDLWCIFIDVGFRQKGISLEKTNKGSSTYSLKKKIKMGSLTIISSSFKPLTFIGYLGLLFSTISFFWFIYLVVMKFQSNVPLGWTSLIVSIWLIGGIIMFSISVLGAYIAKIFSETRNSPSYVIKKIYEHTT